MARGSVFRKGGGWAFRVDAGINPETGSRRQILRQGFATKKAAEEGLTEVSAASARGAAVARSTVRLKDYLTDWLVTVRPKLRPSTFHSYSLTAGRISKSRSSSTTRSQEAFELLGAGWDMSQEPVTKTLGAPPGSSEGTLRDAGTWETIRHHRLTFGADDVQRPRLEVSYLARRAGFLDGSPPSVPFAIVSSIRDRSGNADLHDQITSSFPTLTPLPRSQARVQALRTRASRERDRRTADPHVDAAPTRLPFAVSEPSGTWRAARRTTRARSSGYLPVLIVWEGSARRRKHCGSVDRMPLLRAGDTRSQA